MRNSRIRIAPLIAVILSISLAAFLSQKPCAQELTAEQVVDKAMKVYDGINSHKYTWYTRGMDTFTKERQKAITGQNETLAKKAKVEHEVEEKPKLVRGQYEIEFMKPYLSQMKVIKSDFTPSIVWGTLITYRSDKDQDVWWAKPKISPIAIKRNVEKDDAGGAFTSNWSASFLNILYYMQNSDISLQPDAEFDGKQCRVVRLTFDWNKRPKWDHKKPPFSKYQVPAPVEKIIWDGMLDIERQKFSHIDYFFEKETFYLVNSMEYINGEFHWQNSFKNVEVNTLNEKDF